MFKKFDILIKDEDFKELERQAKKINIPTHKLGRNLILAGLNDFENLIKYFNDTIKLGAPKKSLK